MNCFGAKSPIVLITAFQHYKRIIYKAGSNNIWASSHTAVCCELRVPAEKSVAMAVSFAQKHAGLELIWFTWQLCFAQTFSNGDILTAMYYGVIYLN